MKDYVANLLKHLGDEIDENEKAECVDNIRLPLNAHIKKKAYVDRDFTVEHLQFQHTDEEGNVIKDAFNIASDV